MNAQSSEALANTEAQKSPSQIATERAEASKPKAAAESVKDEPGTPESSRLGERKDHETTTSTPVTPKKKRKSPEKPWKKPPDMPRRPLSAYNLFFQDEKNRLKAERISSGQAPATRATETHEEDDKKSKPKRKHVAVSGIGFANLAKTVAAKWKSLDAAARAPYEERAAVDKARYQKEVAIWRAKEKEKKAREMAAQTRAGLAASQGRTGLEPFDVPPAPSDQSLASLSALDHPVDWFPTGGERHPQDLNVPPQIQTNPRASSHPGRLSPSPPVGYAEQGHYTNPSSLPGMSPLGMTNSPPGSSYGIHTFHNQTTGAQSGRVQMPVFSDTQNSYSHNSVAQMGGAGQYYLQPRRSVPFLTGPNPTSPEWGVPMQQYMQQSSMLQPLQAFPDDPIAPQDNLPHPVQFQQQPQQFASFASANPFYDSYQQQELGDSSLSPQQQFQLQNSYMQSMQAMQQPTGGTAQSQPQPPQLYQPQIGNPSDFFDDNMVEFLTRPSGNRRMSGPGQPPQHPGNP